MKIISVEVDGPEGLTIFRQLDNGKVVKCNSNYRRWALDHASRENGWLPLKGSGYYKCIKFFPNKQSQYYERQISKDMFMIFDEKEAALVITKFNYYKGLTLNDVGTLSIDIESDSINKTEKSKVYTIACTFKQWDRVTRKLFAYDQYANQAEMFKAFCIWVREIDPSIVVGHNIWFDLGYLAHCAKLSGTTLDLGRDASPIKFEAFERKFRKDGSQAYSYQNAYIYGREIIDTLFLAIKTDTSRKYSSYGLKTIIKEEGLERADRQHYDASQIYKLVGDPVEWEKIKTYCQHDADQSLDLYYLFAPAFFYLAQSVPKSFQMIVNTASGSQINAWLMRSYLSIAHSVPRASDPLPYVGGISIGNPGLYRNVGKFDVASLYPNIMRHYGVRNGEKDPLGNFPKMIEGFTKERLENKRLYKDTGDLNYKALSDAQKIIINSCYGFLGAPGLNFNSPEHAAFVTEKGREILNQAMDWCKLKGFTLVNADTDSIAFCKNDQSLMGESERTALLSNLNSQFPELIQFEDDGYYDSVLVVKAKNYVLRRGETITVKGSALKATTKEPALRECITRLIRGLLDGGTEGTTPLEQEYVREIENLTDIRRWAAKKTITAKVLAHSRTQERKIFEAIQGTDYREGDKVFVYFTPEGALKLADRWDNDHCKVRLLKKLKQTIKVVNGKKAA